MKMRYVLVISAEEDVEREVERVAADLPAMLEEVEENLTDLLPEGYTATFEQETQNGGVT